jgi:hypothetical protein
MSSAFCPENGVRWPCCCPLILCPHRTGALDCADNATGFRINPLSCTSLVGHPRLRLAKLLHFGQRRHGFSSALRMKASAVAEIVACDRCRRQCCPPIARSAIVTFAGFTCQPRSSVEGPMEENQRFWGSCCRDKSHRKSTIPGQYDNALPRASTPSSSVRKPRARQCQAAATFLT